MRSVHIYVKLASSWKFLWLKLEWKVLWSLPLYFLSCKYLIFHSSHLYPPALSTLLSYLGSFNMNYITFRIIESFKTYLFKKIIMKENKECFNMHKIFFTWNIQNKIIIGHWDVELAMILSLFLFFQVFTGVLVPPACEHPKEKK
jgi:hypothetical protein